MKNKFKITSNIFIALIIATMPAFGHSHHSSKKAPHKHTHSHSKKHYLLHHDHHHISDPKHPKSPKWHPTNPHSGNFAD